VQVLLAESAAVPDLQLSPHRGDNPAPVLCASAVEDFGTDTMTELPVESGKCGIGGHRKLSPCSLDHLTEFPHERSHVRFVQALS
jgi:hypothetical protein